MLDVHPPEHPAHSWTDFFIHIATIVLGLLIAIGLEQTVEFVHHRHQLAEIRAALDQERDLDLHRIELNRGLTAKLEADLSEDARLLQRRAAGDRSSLAGKLDYHLQIYALNNAAWQTATESAVLGLMPDAARERYSYHYHVIDTYQGGIVELNRDLDRAAAIVSDNPDGKFSEEDTHELIEMTHEVQGLLAHTERMLSYAGKSSQ